MVKYFDILSAKQAYEQGKNVTELLRHQLGVDHNTPDIIEAAYDVQSGTYIEEVQKNAHQADLYTSELAFILDCHINNDTTLLDIGTGELTTLSLLTQRLHVKPKHILACDVSWSRIYKGLPFAKREMGAMYDVTTPFVADIGELPLKDKSVDVTTSSHALEPNGCKLGALLAELFRVTRDKLVLFEPSYELNSDEGRRRMERLGYIKHMEETVTKLGGTLLERIPIRNINNPLNPTACYVIQPPASNGANDVRASELFSVPGTDMPLTLKDGFYTSSVTGLCYPVLKGIPVLRSTSAVLASCFDE